MIVGDVSSFGRCLHHFQLRLHFLSEFGDVGMQFRSLVLGELHNSFRIHKGKWCDRFVKGWKVEGECGGNGRMRAPSLSPATNRAVRERSGLAGFFSGVAASHHNIIKLCVMFAKVECVCVCVLLPGAPQVFRTVRECVVSMVDLRSIRGPFSREGTRPMSDVWV